jgi:hypothetical protein
MGNSNEMEWISVQERLPEPNNPRYETKTIIVSVHCDSWAHDKSMVFDWVTEDVRGKVISRFKWRDRLVIPQWVVTHWMPLPEKPNL